MCSSGRSSRSNYSSSIRSRSFRDRGSGSGGGGGGSRRSRMSDCSTGMRFRMGSRGRVRIGDGTW